MYLSTYIYDYCFMQLSFNEIKKEKELQTKIPFCFYIQLLFLVFFSSNAIELLSNVSSFHSKAPPLALIGLVCQGLTFCLSGRVLIPSSFLMDSFCQINNFGLTFFPCTLKMPSTTSWPPLLLIRRQMLLLLRVPCK